MNVNRILLVNINQFPIPEQIISFEALVFAWDEVVVSNVFWSKEPWLAAREQELKAMVIKIKENSCTVYDFIFNFDCCLAQEMLSDWK